MNYRIKHPRCFVIRWRWPWIDTSADYYGGPGLFTDRAGAAEYPTAAAAFAVRTRARRAFWCVVRRGRVSR